MIAWEKRETFLLLHLLVGFLSLPPTSSKHNWEVEIKYTRGTQCQDLTTNALEVIVVAICHHTLLAFSFSIVCFSFYFNLVIYCFNIYNKIYKYTRI